MFKIVLTLVTWRYSTRISVAQNCFRLGILDCSSPKYFWKADIDIQTLYVLYPICTQNVLRKQGPFLSPLVFISMFFRWSICVFTFLLFLLLCYFILCCYFGFFLIEQKLYFTLSTAKVDFSKFYFPKNWSKVQE